MVYLRASAGCSRIDSMVYCIGGAVYDQKSYLNARYLNDHIALDLLQINNDFSTFNPSQLTWMTLSNINNKTGKPIQPIAFSAATSLSSDNGYVFYGGVQYTNNHYSVPDDIFMQYNSKEDIWHPLPALPNEREFSRTTIVNIGNDVLWKCGGLITSGEPVNNTANLYDYKNSTWSGKIIDPTYYAWFGISNHTSTLAGTTIYRVGGSQFSSVERETFPFSLMYTFSTTDMKWAVTETKGIRPSDREHHTATYLPDKNLILLYGGAIFLGGSASFLEDNYVIYNITSNSYIRIEETVFYPFSKKRFGHYATLYNSNYLLLMFGYTENLQASDAINVINITDPLKPIWIANKETIIDENNQNDGLSKTTLIIIIVITIITVLSIILGIVIYLRRKSKKDKEIIQLEKEDPRNTFYSIAKPFDNINEDDVIKPFDNSDDHVIKPFDNNERVVLKPYDSTNGDDIAKPHDSQQENHIKSNEECKPKPLNPLFCEKTLLVEKEEVEVEANKRESAILSPTFTSTDSITLLGTPLVEICKPSEDKNFP